MIFDMQFYSEMEEFKIYRTPISLDIDRSTKEDTKPNIIILLGKNFDDSKKILNDIFDPRYFKNSKISYRAYYIDRIYKYRVGPVGVKYNLYRTPIYNEIRETYPPLRRLYKDINIYKDTNLILDFYKHNILFEEAVGDKSDNLKLKIFFENLSNRLKDLPQAIKESNKIVPIRLDMDNVKDIDKSLKVDSILSYITALGVRPLNIEFGEEFDIDLIFYSGRSKVRMNLLKYIESSKDIYIKLRTALNKLKSAIDTDVIDEHILDSEVQTAVDIKVDKDVSFSLTGDVTPPVDSKGEVKLKEIVKDKASERMSAGEEIKTEDIESIIDEDEVKIKLVQELNKSNSLGTTPRDRELREKALTIKLKDKTIEEILKESEDSAIPENIFSINTTNDNMKSSTMLNFNKKYNEDMKDSDIVGMMNSFQDAEVPLYIREIDKVDSSDAFNKKETWTVKFEDAKRVRHTVKFDVPLFVDDKFLYLGGNKKNVLNQLVLKPVVKTAPDTVQLCTNYNKIFLTRYGMKMTPKTERFVKALSTATLRGVDIKRGNSKSANSKYKTTLEYDIVAESIMSIGVKSTGLIINFTIDENPTKSGKYDDITTYLPIGSYKGKTIYLRTLDDNVVGDNISTPIHFIDFIVDNLITSGNPKFSELYFDTSVGTKFVYTRATIMAKKIPLILLLSYCEGITTVLNKAKINYYFSDKRTVFKGVEKDSKGIVPFSDGYLIYDKYPMENSLLMNGLSTVDTKKYSINDLNERLTYVDIFRDLVNAPNIVGPFNTFYNCFIDKPITLSVLNDLNLPTDFVSLLLYGNTLLGDNDFIPENDLNNYRLRNAEIVTSIVYKQFSKAYGNYLSTHTNKNPVKVSIPQNAIINEINSSNIVEDYSTLSPTLELERLRAVTFKGPNGLNLEQAYTLDKRSFHQSMLGIVAMSSPPTGAVGLTRYLSVNPRVTNARGYLDVIQSKDEIKDLNQANVLMTSEMITPTVGMRDDAPRLAMNTAQTKHIVPVTKGSPLLMGSGIERSMPYLIGDDFAFKAKKAGVVKDIKDNIVFLQYSDGTTDFIDLSLSIEKNGGSGYYISNQLKLDDKVKKGYKFKELDILAYNDKFFSNNDIKGDKGFKMGALKKIAILNDQETFEDSTSLSRETAEDLGTEVVMKKQVILDKNANIDLKSIVKVGDNVVSGESLIVYEEGFDKDMSKVLGSIRADLQDDISEFGKKPVKSKYSGEIVDIKIYYNCEYDEMSSSLKKLINSYKSDIDKKNKIIKQNAPDAYSPITVHSVEKYESYDGKIKGVTVDDGVLIEFYVRYLDVMSVGDKLTNFCALKSIACKIYDEPKFTEFRPEEPLGAELGTRSYMARMTGSIIVNSFTNKVLIELARACKAINAEDEEVYDRIDGKYLTSEIK